MSGICRIFQALGDLSKQFSSCLLLKHNSFKLSGSSHLCCFSSIPVIRGQCSAQCGLTQPLCWGRSCPSGGQMQWLWLKMGLHSGGEEILGGWGVPKPWLLLPPLLQQLPLWLMLEMLESRTDVPTNPSQWGKDSRKKTRSQYCIFFILGFAGWALWSFTNNVRKLAQGMHLRLGARVGHEKVHLSPYSSRPGWMGLEQPDLVEGVPPGKVVGTRWALTILWFYIYFVMAVIQYQDDCF